MIFTINNLEEFLDPTLLQRGMAYLEQDAITEVEEFNKNEFAAIIQGTTVYNVNIRINSTSELLTHVCNCPYSGPICKHKVAVLLKIKENKKNGTPFTAGKLTQIKDELNNRNNAELNQLLLVLAKSNINTRNQILRLLDIALKNEKSENNKS